MKRSGWMIFSLRLASSECCRQEVIATTSQHLIHCRSDVAGLFPFDRRLDVRKRSQLCRKQKSRQWIPRLKVIPLKLNCFLYSWEIPSLTLEVEIKNML
jgi:hypothetical protein